MSKNVKFQLYKVSRFIKVQGETFDFKRPKLNDFREPIKGEFDVVSIKGVYHEVNSQVTETGADGSVTRSKPQPRVLCMPDDGAKVKNGDTLVYKGTKYKVVEAANPVKYDVCADISLEVVQDG